MNTLASRGQLRASFFRWALVTIPAVLLLGFLSGKVAPAGAENGWFMGLAMPEIMPPFWAFPLAWTVLYLLMGIALALVCAAWGARGRGWAIGFFVLQLMVNLVWTPIFFGLHDIRLALIVIGVLDVLVLVTAILFWRVRRFAAVLLLPYFAWIAFATALTWQFLVLNPAPAGEDSGAVQRVEL